MDHSKAYTSYKNKMLHFDDDLELVDILYAAIKKNKLENEEGLFEFQDKQKHPNISRYKICHDNRLLVMRHLKATMSASYVKELYEEFTIYLKSIIFEAYQNAAVDPGRIIGEHKVTMNAVDILSRLNNNTLVQSIIDSMFQSLENERSTISLISKTCKKLGIEVEEQKVTDAVYYLEIRHKLVHTDGYADEDFKATHPTLKYNSSGYIDLKYQTLQLMRKSLLDLIEAIDEDAIKKGILKSHVAI